MANWLDKIKAKTQRAPSTRPARPGKSAWSPQTAATLHSLLGEIARLNRLSDMPRKIALCEQALLRVRREDNPPLWAAFQGELANALVQNPQGPHADNLEEAIRHYELAFQVLTREAFPPYWATAQNNLANAYSDRIRGPRADNLEEAIRRYELALQVFTRKAFPADWAGTQNNLAHAYNKRIVGVRTDNLEDAIRRYELALQVYTREVFPIDWAMTQNNLANAYFDRIQGARADNLEEAIRHHELALQVRTHEALPEQWAGTQNNLANAYFDRIQGARADNLEEAIRHYELTLQVYTREASPIDWAMTQNNLATAYLYRIRGKRADNLEEAIRYYELALQVYTREAFPEQWAMTQNNLAVAYSDRIRGERADNLEEAIRHYELALQVRTREAFPRDTQQSAQNLGVAYARKGDWPSARAAYALAIQPAEDLFRASVSPTNQADSARQLADLYNRDIDVCLHLYPGDVTVARDVLIAAEAARSRAFLKQLGLRDFTPPAALLPSLVESERQAREQLRQIEEKLAHTNTRADRATEDERSLVARRATLMHELEQTWDQMLTATPAARDYVALRRGDTPAWDNLQKLAAQLGTAAALVEFHNLADRIVAIIWRAGWDVPRLVVIPLNQRELIQRYLLSYEREIINRRALEIAGRTPLNDWQKLGDALLAPLESELGDATLVYFIPHGVLHLIPLHALIVHGEPFIARRAVAYTPSAAALDRALSSTNGGQSAGPRDQALVMGVVFVQEAIDIARHFGVTALVNAAANRAALEERASAASIIHLSCHGRFNSDDALASAVLLADGEVTARDWMQLRLNADLVTLSACQLGISEQNPGDDLVGMARALMYAGASSLLLTFWSVRADTTKDWMLDFYRRVWKTPHAGKSQPEAYAVRDAVLALRETNPDPYVWAPFVLIGDWR